jgi:HPt (histidine-containing phosphotransfer) domain-containing protein
MSDAQQGTPPPRAEKNPKPVNTLLATLWERNLPLLRERCAELDQAVAQARAGNLSAQLRQDALSTAHKLAGSLGMFGYPEGTDYARRVEERLQASAPIDAEGLAADVAAMRAAVGL